MIAILVLALPLLEIAGFVVVGSEIGVLPTIALVLLSGVAGSLLLRWQGFGALGRIRREIEAGNPPGREVAHGLMIMIAGILLLIPGFVSDIFGLLLFIPAVRELAWRYLRSRITVVTNFGAGAGSFRRPGQRDQGRTIDLDQDEYSSKGPDPKSPWRRPELE
nr:MULTISPECIES: FxsA family protein [unclassified Mesorhizobium]